MVVDDNHPDLFGLLKGELANHEVTTAGAHLERCERCRHELAQTTVGHALLRGSARTLAPASSATPGDPPALPPLARPRARPRRAGMLVAAVAVLGLAAGGLVTAALSDDPTVSQPPAPRTVASASLLPIEDGVAGVSADARMYRQSDGRTTMRIRTTDLPPAGTGRFYYAWLLDPRTQKMLPLGQLGADGGSFDVADGTLSAYSAVDVSLEDDDGDPGHSVTSVLRGDY